jgi:hypothetical protein
MSMNLFLKAFSTADLAAMKQYSAQLSGWSHERLLKGLRDLNPADEAYHLEYFRDEEQDLVIEFDKLVAFYRDAASKNLAVLHYAA